MILINYPRPGNMSQEKKKTLVGNMKSVVQIPPVISTLRKQKCGITRVW